MNIRHEFTSLSIFLDTLGTPFGFSAVYLFGWNYPQYSEESGVKLGDKFIDSKSTPRIKSNAIPIICSCSNSKVREMFVGKIKWAMYRLVQ